MVRRREYSCWIHKKKQWELDLETMKILDPETVGTLDLETVENLDLETAGNHLNLEAIGNLVSFPNSLELQ